MKNIDPNATEERKTALRTLCEIDSYLPIIEQCLTDEQKAAFRPVHMAGFLAAAAELWFKNYDGLGQAFDRNKTLTMDFKAVLAIEKDATTLQYKPVEVCKDTVSVNLPIENEPELPGMKKTPAPPVAPKETPPVEVEGKTICIGHTPEVLGLPAPDGETVVEAEIIEPLSDEETLRIEGIRDEGMDARSVGTPRDKNPYPFGSTDRAVWSQGWDAQQAFIEKSAGFNDPEEPADPSAKPKRTRKAKPPTGPVVDVPPSPGIEDNDGPGPEIENASPGGVEIVEGDGEEA